MSYILVVSKSIKIIDNLPRQKLCWKKKFVHCFMYFQGGVDVWCKFCPKYVEVLTIFSPLFNPKNLIFQNVEVIFICIVSELSLN